jgi:ribosome-binding protein aMBF1 (putative translation factor)
MEHDTQQDDVYSPVPFDRAEALARARLRPGFNEAWDALEEEYAALGALLEARKAAGLTQEALAKKMGTTKSAVSRLESSLRDERHSPSFATLKKYAHACGKKLVVQLV